MDKAFIAYDVISKYFKILIFNDLLARGYIHSYIDFFYVVNNTMPQLIIPG